MGLSLYINFVSLMLQFLGGLFAIGFTLTTAMYISLKLRFPKQKFSIRSIAWRVIMLMLWMWSAMQAMSVLFSQAETVAPTIIRPLLRPFGALQFQGVTLDPACYSSIPFQSFWVALGTVTGLISFGLCSLITLPHYPFLTALILQGIGLAIQMGYGALTTKFFASVACTDELAMSVSEYLNAISDGQSLLTALGSSNAPPLALLKRASLDPLFAASSGLSGLLRTSIPVSVLVSNPFQVCREGPHRIVRYLGLTFIALFSLGFPTLGLWALWAVGRLKGLRRRVFKRVLTGGGGSAQQHSPTLRASALVTAFVDPILLKHRAWTSFFDYYTLTAISGCLSVQGGVPTPFFLAMQMTVIVTSLILIAVLAHGWQLYITEHAWKLPAKLALCSIVILAATFNCILAFYRKTLSDSERLTLSLTPPILALVINVLVIYFWWCSCFLLEFLKQGLGEKKDPSFTDCVNPLFTLTKVAEPPQEDAQAVPWRRHKDEDGDEFWFNPGTHACEWVLPRGSSTECGWVWMEKKEGGGEGGMHPLTGAFTPHPPSASTSELEVSPETTATSTTYTQDVEDVWEGIEREAENIFKTASSSNVDHSNVGDTTGKGAQGGEVEWHRLVEDSEAVFGSQPHTLEDLLAPITSHRRHRSERGVIRSSSKLERG